MLRFDDRSKESDPPIGAPARAAGPIRFPLALLRTARPRQWVKNLLVFAAPAAAGVLGHPGPLERAFAAFAIFCLASIGTYFLNDSLDAPADRLHPTKRLRPVAAGALDSRVALILGPLLLAGSVLAAAALAGWQFAAVVGAYGAISVSYSLGVKHVPVVELGCVSSGFALRAIAGGTATGVPLSDWFVIVACFGSLLVASGKRTAEVMSLGEEGVLHRPALAAYPLTFLRSVRVFAGTVLVTAYCLWAFERAAHIAHHPHTSIWFELSIVPVVLTVLYLELCFEKGKGGAPEELALGDHVLQLLGACWAALLAVGIYG